MIGFDYFEDFFFFPKAFKFQVINYFKLKTKLCKHMDYKYFYKLMNLKYETCGSIISKTKNNFRKIILNTA